METIRPEIGFLRYYFIISTAMIKNTAYSRIIAGVMTWGQWGKGFSSKEVSDLIGYCLDIGITTFMGVIPLRLILVKGLKKVG